jgi:hypothetical protein
LSCRTGPLRAGRPLRGGYTRFARALPLVGTNFIRDPELALLEGSLPTTK